MLLQLTILSLLSLAWTEKTLYTNYTLYKVHPQNENHLLFLKDLYEDSDGLDFWKPPSRVDDYVSVVSAPEVRAEFEHSLLKRSIQSEVMLENIQEAFDAQVYSRRKRESDQLHWTAYQTQSQIIEWFDQLAATHSNIVTIVKGGTSFEDRKITGVRIARGSPSRAFVLIGGEIGADWLSPTVLTYVVNQLVTGEDPEARAASEDFAWYIFPIVNPDGHEFSDNSVRLWVKNRRPTSGGNIGVDLSKNWNAHWGVSGGSFVPASNNFIGLGPFSEVETRTLSRFIETIPNLSGFLTYRSFGQRILIPFAHTTEPMHNYLDMIKVGRRAAGSLSVRYNTRYIVDVSMLVSDGATGSASDWAKHRFNPPVAATFLLRDEGSWGYLLPVAQVLPSCEETYDALMAIVREARFTNVL